jgi:all-trans-retinol 13,14-reductase
MDPTPTTPGGPPQRDFDVVVIGSGIGGLTAASLLGRLHRKRVLVLERHFRAGGFTHTFSRPGGFRWDVGVHYVGGVAEGRLARRVMDVVTGGALRWEKMGEPFERLRFPGLQFDLRSGRERLRADLHAAFPAERAGIDAYLRDVLRAATWVKARAFLPLFPGPVAGLARWVGQGRERLARQTTEAWLAAHIVDPRLRAVLGARWADFGLPPSQSAFGMHAVIAEHYLEGAWYPVGSAAQVARGATAVIEAAGGQVRVRAEVSRVLLERGRAVGVRLVSGEEVRAPLVISDAGARNTYLRLVPPEAPLPFRAQLEAVPRSMAHATVYLGLSDSPRTLGIHGENFWLHDELDHDALWRGRDEATRGVVRHAYLSFPSLKDPEATAHTAEIVLPMGYGPWAPWAEARWRRRGAEHDALKQGLADAALAAVERHLPGLRALVRFTEVSTPLTTEHFTAHPGGEIYGLPFSPARFELPWLGVTTPVPGLLLTGADAMAPGIVGAMMGGVLATVKAAGFRTFPALDAAAAQLRRAPRLEGSAASTA